jgi:hypothetical protein
MNGQRIPCDKLFRDAANGYYSVLFVATTGGMGGVGGETGGVMASLGLSATRVNGQYIGPRMIRREEKIRSKTALTVYDDDGSITGFDGYTDAGESLRVWYEPFGRLFSNGNSRGQQEPVILPTSQHRNVPLVLPPIHTPCTFNINIISSSISGDYLDSVKENIKSIFNKNGHNVVFNNPRAARRTVRGSTDLTIVEDWSRSQARILRRIGEDLTQVGGMYIRRTNKIWGNDTVATLASIRDDVSNDLVLGQYISH